MAGHPHRELLDFERWLQESRAEAERLLPALLDLSGPELAAELERHRELRPALIQLLLAVAHDASERYPHRAVELTAALIEPSLWSDDPHAQSSRARIERYLRGQAWTAHAAVLRALGRSAEARHAIAVAIDLFPRDVERDWHIATARIVEAQLLHDQGARAEALRRIRRAAADILFHGASDRYVQARMKEAWMHWDAGDQAAAAEVWRATAREAEDRRDPLLLAHVRNRLGLFLLHHGDVEEAERQLAAAHHTFDAHGLTREATRVHWSLAEAAAARGSLHEAISEHRKVRALLLAAGDLRDAAIASADILDLLLLAGRGHEVLPEAERFLDDFREAGLKLNALQAWTFVRNGARTGALIPQHLTTVRRYFEDFPLRPNARFLVPEPAR